LADPHPVDFVHFARETIVGFIRERCGNDSFHPSAMGSISKKSRVNAVAGDNPEDVWSFHESILRRKSQRPKPKPAVFEGNPKRSNPKPQANPKRLKGKKSQKCHFGFWNLLGNWDLVVWDFRSNELRRLGFVFWDFRGFSRGVFS
jgi:hypothetical protein